MTTAVAVTPETAALEQEIALIACGTRPGKTKACDRHQKKGPVLVEIASRGDAVPLAAAICGSEARRACLPCVEKAVEIIRVYLGEDV